MFLKSEKNHKIRILEHWLLTGAALHARDLRHHKLSSVVFLRMTADEFQQRYLQPLDVKAVTSCRL